MGLINAYTIRPYEIKSGDVALFIVKAMVVRTGAYRLYRCRYPVAPDSNEIPQGDRMVNEEEVCQALFPSLAMIAKPDRHI